MLLHRLLRVVSETHVSKKLLKECATGDIDSIGRYIRVGGINDICDDHGMTPAMWIANRYGVSRNKSELYRNFRSLILGSKHLDATDNAGRSCLHYCVLKGFCRGISLLLDCGANIEMRSADGNTPLLFASWNGAIDSAKLLIERGANVNAKNNKGECALMCSNWHGDKEMVEILVENGADISVLSGVNDRLYHDLLPVYERNRLAKSTKSTSAGKSDGFGL